MNIILKPCPFCGCMPRIQQDDQNMQNTKGRPRIEVAPDSFAEQARCFNAREVTAEQAAAALGISRSTFCRRLKADRYPRPKYDRISVFEIVCSNYKCIIGGVDDHYYRSLEEAAEAWNRRAQA